MLIGKREGGKAVEVNSSLLKEFEKSRDEVKS